MSSILSAASDRSRAHAPGALALVGLLLLCPAHS
jgi:hypothetical protein